MPNVHGGALQGRSVQGPGGGGGRPAPAPAADGWWGFTLRVEGGAVPSLDDQLADKMRKARVTLQPGEAYRVVMVPRAAMREGGVRVAVVAGGRFVLFFDGWKGVRVRAREYVLEDDAQASLRHAFDVAVPDDCPAEDGEFALFYSMDGSDDELEEVARLPVGLGGSFGARDVEFLKSIRVVPDKPPPRVALLHIQTAPGGGLLVRGGVMDGAARWRWLGEEAIGAIPGEVGTLVQRRAEPRALVQAVKLLSWMGTAPLQAWLRELLRDHPNGSLHLVIYDHTYSQMPWEMLKIRLPDGGEGWLGEHVRVSRWLPVSYYDEERKLDFAANPPQGSALAYLDLEGLGEGGVDLERRTLAQLGVQPCPTLDEVIESVSRRASETGLVYLAAHGTFTTGDNILRALMEREIGIGASEDAGGDGFALLDVDRFTHCADPRPALFVNACHSARMFRSPELGPIGLPRALLGGVAGLYVGTLGPVGMTYASELAARFLRAAAEGGVNPAEFLRETRARAAQALRDADTPENWVNLVFAFLYVVYGNPLARLRIRPGDAAVAAPDDRGSDR